eukprot:m.155106 g.155106  ORF g.155106 m.155106 type:complete len:333 (-) comp20804_c0_seq1:83-1081(-)
MTSWTTRVQMKWAPSCSAARIARCTSSGGSIESSWTPSVRLLARSSSSSASKKNATGREGSDGSGVDKSNSDSDGSDRSGSKNNNSGTSASLREELKSFQARLTRLEQVLGIEEEQEHNRRKESLRKRGKENGNKVDVLHHKYSNMQGRVTSLRADLCKFDSQLSSRIDSLETRMMQQDEKEEEEEKEDEQEEEVDDEEEEQPVRLRRSKRRAPLRRTRQQQRYRQPVLMSALQNPVQQQLAPVDAAVCVTQPRGFQFQQQQQRQLYQEPPRAQPELQQYRCPWQQQGAEPYGFHGPHNLPDVDVSQVVHRPTRQLSRPRSIRGPFYDDPYV